MSDRDVTLDVDAHTRVSALLRQADQARAALVLAHGAGAGMRHAFMQSVADGLAARRISTLRYQFPSMERGSSRVDPPAVAWAAVRAAVAHANAAFDALPLFAGGKSFGARMTSQAQADAPLTEIRGLVFFGFPLHPAGKPSLDRAAHLVRVGCPMLFLQGTRDTLAELPLVEQVVASLGSRAALAIYDDADHSFHVRAKSGHTDAETLAAMLDRAVQWMTTPTQ
jgi:predicted alpha/beta-hydrolase family hydrolase